MPQEPETPAVDWRAEAEEIGRQAFEQATATAEPQPTPEPAAWWESQNTKGKKEPPMKKTPHPKPATTPAAVPDVIRQSELQALADTQRQFNATIIAIRKRIRNGALVEPGEINASSDHDTERHTVEWFEEPICGFYECGLNVDWKN